MIVPSRSGAGRFNQLQALAQQANAVDMCVMLKAQYIAHWLDTHVPVNLQVADYSDAGSHHSTVKRSITTMR